MTAQDRPLQGLPLQDATSAGLRDEMPPLPGNAFRGAELAYELAYS